MSSVLKRTYFLIEKFPAGRMVWSPRGMENSSISEEKDGYEIELVAAFCDATAKGEAGCEMLAIEAV